MRFLILLLMLSNAAFAQISVTTKIVGSTDFTLPPRLVGNKVLYDPKTKVSEGLTAYITVAGPYNVFEVTAERLEIVDGKIVVTQATVDNAGSNREFTVTGKGAFFVDIRGYGESIGRHPRFSIELDAVEPGPGPKPPGPNPPGPEPPAPTPVTSFRVIFVKESGSTLNAEQTAITGAKAVRDYLTTKTTPEAGFAGWREYDPQQNITNERPQMKALWAATKSSITTVPCVIVEVNGKPKILPYPKDTADALKTLKEYGGQ